MTTRTRTTLRSEVARLTGCQVADLERVAGARVRLPETVLRRLVEMARAFSLMPDDDQRQLLDMLRNWPGSAS